MRKRIVFGLIGSVIGTGIGLAMRFFFGFQHISLMTSAGWGLAIVFGQYTKQIEPEDLSNKPISLFPDGIPGRQ